MLSQALDRFFVIWTGTCLRQHAKNRKLGRGFISVLSKPIAGAGALRGIIPALPGAIAGSARKDWRFQTDNLSPPAGQTKTPCDPCARKQAAAAIAAEPLLSLPLASSSSDHSNVSLGTPAWVLLPIFAARYIPRRVYRQVPPGVYERPK